MDSVLCSMHNKIIKCFGDHGFTSSCKLIKLDVAVMTNLVPPRPRYCCHFSSWLSNFVLGGKMVAGLFLVKNFVLVVQKISSIGSVINKFG